jgi:serine phosphatase RsbU (regulator of sigma subunit)
MDAYSNSLWRRWLAAIGACCFVLAFAATWYADRVADRLRVPEQLKTSEVIGQSLVADLDRAVGYGIPLTELPGIEPWLGDVVESNPLISAIAIADRQGQLLTGYAVSQEFKDAIAQAGSSDSNTVEGTYVRTLALRASSGAGESDYFLHVVGRPPVNDFQLLLIALTIAAVCTAMSAVLLRLIILKRLGSPLAATRSALEGLVAGRIEDLPKSRLQGPAPFLQSSLAARLSALSERYRLVLQRVAEVRAAHFDPQILQRLDELVEGLSAWDLRALDTEPLEFSHRKAQQSLIRRVVLATVGALACVLLGGAILFKARDDANAAGILKFSDAALSHAWRSVASRDAIQLNASLNTVLADRVAMDLLNRDQFDLLRDRLSQLAPEQVSLTFTKTDGTVVATNAPIPNSVRPTRTTLQSLRGGQSSIVGVWQSYDLEYQAGAAAGIVIGNAFAEDVVLIASRPLSESLGDLERLISGPVALADLRGQPVFDANAEIVGLWRKNGRRGFVDNTGDRPSALSTLVLNDESGRMLGTLMSRMPTASDADRQDIGKWLLALALIASAGIGLVYYLPRLLAPIAASSARLEGLSAAESLSDRQTSPAVLNAFRLDHAIGRLEAMIRSFNALRRSRDRQGQRQARFIRHQMTGLASRLGDEARVAILADLDRIEGELATLPLAATTQPVALVRDFHHEQVVDEIGILALGFQNLASRVGDQYEQLDKLVAELREALRVKTQFVAIQQELEIARKMQLAILPRDFATRNGLAIQAKMQPAKEIGGDFYDFFALDEHHVAMTVADVSGKGVPAALFMAVSRTLLRAVAQFSDSPAKCLVRLNDLLAADNERMMFVTLFYAILDTRDGKLVYANAGHNLPYVLRATGALEAIGQSGGMALAIVEGNEYEDHQVTLAPGDRLFMYTDGVTEAFDPQGQMFGEPRLELMLERMRSLAIADIPERVIFEVNDFEAGGPQTDDITCLTASFQEEAGPV